MVKTIVAVVIALVLLNTAWFVLKITVLIWTEAREEKRLKKARERSKQKLSKMRERV